MSVGEGSFAGASGVEIAWRSWLPAGEPLAAVVISHGGGEHSGRYGHVATALNEAGYAVWALDHVGHGRSGGERMRFDAIEPLAADLRTMVAVAQDGTPGRRPFLLAHSTGVAIALPYVFDHQEELAGLVLSGSLALMDGALPRRLAARAIARIAPGLGVFKVDPETVSRDPEVVRAYGADPLNFHGKFPAKTVAVLDRNLSGFPERLPSLRLPLLVMHGADDELTTPDGSRLVYDLASSADKTLRLYDGLRHEILNEPEWPEIVAEIIAWLNARVSG